jgi:ubiquinone/menaquinone biosynthesis C-methylase UbiE
MKKLNIGCGKLAKKGYVNLDKHKFPGVDKVWNLDKFPYPFRDNEFDEILCFNILEFVGDFIKTMEEIYRIAKPNAIIKVLDVPSPSPFSFQNPLVRTRISYNTFDYYIKDGGTENYLFKPTFRIMKKKYIFSKNKYLDWISFFINLFPKFYTRFLFNIFYSNYIYFELKVIK